MSTVTSSLESYRAQLRLNRLGLWLFFISEAFLIWRPFGHPLLSVGQHPSRARSGDRPPRHVGPVAQFACDELAEKGMEHNDRRTFQWGLVATFILGTIFLFGVMIFEWGLFPAIYEGHLTPGAVFTARSSLP